MIVSLTDGFICPSCHNTLNDNGARLSCSGCSLRYDIVQGVSMLLPGLCIDSGDDPDPDLIEDISRVAFPYGAGTADAPMHDLFSKRFRFPDPQLSTEGHRFLHRLRASGHVIRIKDASRPAENTSKLRQTSRDRVGLSLTTGPGAVRAGQEFYVQVRISNDGAAVLKATGSNSVVLSYTCKKSFSWTRPVQPEIAGQQYSRLLIDLAPGRTLTQPVCITASNELGQLVYSVKLSGNDAMRASRALKFPITIIPQDAPDPLAVDWT